MRNGSTPDAVRAVHDSVAATVVGQRDAVERILIAVITGGHVLLEGMPGVAKTLIVNAVAKALGLRFARIQFTVDLLPSDIVGSEVFDQRQGKFETKRGPVFANFLLADEINRAAPKVQSALLEAMQERQVTIGSETFPLPIPFVVVATQNPVEMDGTFDLPEAQLDRFMFCHRVGYPSRSAEEEVVDRSLARGLRDAEGGSVPMTAFDSLRDAKPVVQAAELRAMMAAVKAVRVSPVLVKHCVELVHATRQSPDLEFGCSPRASIALAEGARARAFLHGRDFATPEDLFELAEDVVMHRCRMTHAAVAEGKSPRDVLRDILNRFMVTASSA